jgi:NAD(P)-dependent dehydrogenase (short-subunit alcohol dehydrogenase family)
VGRVRNDETSRGVAVVTGGGTGIGAATALRLAEAGFDIGLIGRRHAPLETIATGVRERGGAALPAPADLRHEDEIDRAVGEIVEALGPVRVLVNMAGLPRFAKLDELALADLDAVLETNLRGTIVATRAVLPSMREAGGGLVVNVSSEVAARGLPTATAYGSSKAAIEYLTRVWAVELAEHGIRTVTVAPGITDTPEGVVAMDDTPRDEFLDWMAQRVPQKRVGRPEWVAATIAFLASEEASYINGTRLAVDGGISVT